MVSPGGGPLPFTPHQRPVSEPRAPTIDGKARQSLVHHRLLADAKTPTSRSLSSARRRATDRGTCHETWQEGQRVKVSAPAGRFVFAGHKAERVVLIAGGIGITPMMSIVRSLTDRRLAGRDVPAVLGEGGEGLRVP